DHDPVGERGEGVRRVFYALIRAGFTSVRLKLYPEGRHEMLNEINRGEVYEDILAWLNKYQEAPHAV
ncbi:MAG: alpha/beta hydrolase, partial [Firmicutes bacterium]|nr:alpha/beta hydrolase [Bacillota bacterium]